MSLLLGADAVTLWAPSPGADAHGWAAAPTAQVWAGTGSLQRQPGRSDDLATGGGGHGPYDPNWGAVAVLYLPPDAAPAEGMVAEVGAEHFALSQVREVRDPTGGGALDCWVATATGTDQWGP